MFEPNRPTPTDARTNPATLLRKVRPWLLLGAVALMSLTPGCGASDDGGDAEWELQDEGATAEAEEAIVLADAPTNAAGGVDGNFSVDAQGAATYSIPINVPPGIRGVEPKLSLSYRSGGANGYLGVGWGLGGLSSITRCPKTIAQDGARGAVNGDANDRFCLDGQRLIVAPGHTYGAHGAEYRTEIESFSRIYSYGTCGTGPCRFEVTDKQGNLAVFGETNAVAKSSDNVTPRVYNLQKLKDPNGNYLTVNYTLWLQQMYPFEIVYTKHDGAAGLRTRRVFFDYEARPDDEFAYVAGTKVITDSRMSRIKTYVGTSTGDKLVRDYRFTYTTSGLTQRSLLQHVHECDGLGVCLPPTTFAYNSNAAGSGPNDKFTMVNPNGTGDENYQHLMRHTPGATLIPADLDADGRSDLLRVERKWWADVPGTNLMEYFSRGDGTFEPWKSSDLEYTNYIHGDVVDIFPLDYNGDGKTDFLRREKGAWDDDNNLTFGVYEAKNSGGFNVYWPTLPSPWGDYYNMLKGDIGSAIITGDFDGDGRGDFIRAAHSWSADDYPSLAFIVYKSMGSQGQFTPIIPTGGEYGAALRSDRVDIITGDFNGDGRTDFIRREKYTWDDDADQNFGVYYSKGDGYFDVFFPAGNEYQVELRSDEFRWPGEFGGANIIPGDFNGDGKTDFIRQQRGFWTDVNPTHNFNVYFSTGKDGKFERVTPQEPSPLPNPIYYGSTMNGNNVDIFPLDYNGDGKTDFIRREKEAWDQDAVNTFHVYISRGDGSFDRIAPGTQGDFYDFYQGGCRGRHANLIPADINGDGKSDFVRQEWDQADDDVNTFQVFFANGDDAGDFLRNVSTGLGATTAVTYGALNDDTVHTTSGASSVSYPNTVARVPMYVVKSTVLGQPGTAETDTYTYTYDTGILNSQGRGFLGFAKVTQDGSVGKTTTYYNQNFPLTGTIKQKDVFGAAGTNTGISVLNTHVTPTTIPGSFAVEQTEEKITHQEGTTIPTPTYEMRKEYVYDNYGNVVITRDLGRSYDATDNVDTCTVWNNDTANWRIALPVSTQIADSCTYTNGSCSCTGVLQKADQVRYGTPNVLQVYEWDNTYGSWVITEYTYDIHGNVLTKSVPGQTTRINETTTYDADYQTFPTQHTRSAGSLSQTTTFQYDARFGALMSQTDANGKSVGNQFDGLGRIAAAYGQSPTGAFVPVTKYSYGVNGIGTYRWSTYLDSWDTDSWRWHQEYLDGKRRVWRSESQTTDPYISVIVLRTYDSFGEIKTESLPHYSGETPKYTTFTRDPLGRVKQIVDVNGTVTTISYAADTWCAQCATLETTVEAAGTANARTTERNKSVDGRVLRQVDPDGRVTTYSFDKLGRQTSMTDAAGTTTWQYDMLNRVLSVTTPDQGTITNWYQPATTWITRTLNTSSWDDVNYQYDALGRVTRKVVAGKHAVDFIYDETTMANGLGRLTSTAVWPNGASTPSSRNTFSYTADGKVAASSVSIDNKQYGLSSAYDPQGRLIKLTYSDGSELSRTYNAQGLLHQLTMGGTTYATMTGYSAAGQPTSMTYANGTSTALTYDAATRISTAKVLQAGSSLLDYSYNWDSLHRITAIGDMRDASHSQTFGYSAAGQLLAANGIYGALTYGYDAAGNLTSKEGSSYTYNGHRVTSGTGFTATYDGSGNRVAQTRGGNNWGYAYDGERHLTQVTKNGAVMNQYAYDFLGTRVKKIDANGTVTHYVSPNYEVVYMPDGRMLKTKYVNAPTGRVAAVTTEHAAGAGAMFDIQTLDVLKAQFAKNTVAGLAKYAENRVTALSLHLQTWTWTRPLVLALLGWLIALTSVRLARHYRPAAVRRVLTTMRAWLWPSSTGYARRNPLYAWAIPLVLASFLSACGQAPGRFTTDENTVSVEQELTPGSNGAGIPEVGTYYFHSNHLDSSSMVTNSSGGVVARAEYKPYGEIVHLPGDGTDLFRSKFTGKEWDNDSQIYDYHARMYDPFTGRFLTADSQAYGGARGETNAGNPYAYANNNPVVYNDPSGNAFFLIPIIIVAVVAGAYAGGSAANGTWNPAQWSWTSWQTYVGMGVGGLVGGATAGMGGSIGGILVGSALNAVAINGLKFLSPEGSNMKEFGIGVATDFAVGAAFGWAMKPAAGSTGSLSSNLGKSGSQTGAQVGREATRTMGRSSLWRQTGEFAKDLGVAGIQAGMMIGQYELERKYGSLSSVGTPNPRASNRPSTDRTDGSTVSVFFRQFNDAVLSASGADDARGRTAGDWGGVQGHTLVARGAKRAPQTYGGYAVLH